MDGQLVETVTSYFDLVAIITCFLVGFVIKNYTKMGNNYIPLLMMATGIIANVIFTISNAEAVVTYNTILAGAISGLASSGFYDLIFKSLGLKNACEKKIEECKEEKSKKEEKPKEEKPDESMIVEQRDGTTEE